MIAAGEGVPYRVGFCISGQGRLFRAAVVHRQRLGITPALVVTDKPPAGDIEAFCASAGLDLVRIVGLGAEAFAERITEICGAAQLDLLCLTFDRILPKALVSRYPGRIINVHTALLPAFAGRRPLERAIATNVRYTGATIHVVTDAIDQGPIVAQCIIATRPDESAESLGDRLFGVMRLMYLQVIAWYAAGRVTDQGGRIVIREAVYGEMPISPAVELAFPD